MVTSRGGLVVCWCGFYIIRLPNCCWGEVKTRMIVTARRGEARRGEARRGGVDLDMAASKKNERNEEENETKLHKKQFFVRHFTYLY